MRETVTLSLRDFKSREVECTRVGPFAVHKSVDGSGHALTHVATGRVVEDGFYDSRNAERLARALEHMADWSFDSVQAVYSMDPNVRALLRAECRWFKRDDTMRHEARRVTARGGEGEK